MYMVDPYVSARNGCGGTHHSVKGERAKFGTSNKVIDVFTTRHGSSSSPNTSTSRLRWSKTPAKKQETCTLYHVFVNKKGEHVGCLHMCALVSVLFSSRVRFCQVAEPIGSWR